MQTTSLCHPSIGPSCLIRPPRILLVEPDTEQVVFYRRVLQAEGFEVRTCSSFAEGSACLARQDFDLIVVDQGSPAFEGRVVLERAMAINRRTPVLILTRSHDIGCYLEAMQLGAVDYLEEPVPPQALVWAVETHLPSSARRHLESPFSHSQSPIPLKH